MSEILARYANPIRGADSVSYAAQACGVEMTDGLWEGWVEFVPLNGGSSVRSPRETTQPNVTAARYWASGLTVVYLEGALNRALHPAGVSAVRASGVRTR